MSVLQNYDTAKIPENIYIKEMIPHIMQLHNEYNAFGTVRQKPKVQRKQGESSLDFVGRFAGASMEVVPRRSKSHAYMQLPCEPVRLRDLSSMSKRPSG